MRISDAIDAAADAELRGDIPLLRDAQDAGGGTPAFAGKGDPGHTLYFGQLG